MGLGKIWRRMRSLSDRPHNLLAISDIHLGSDLRAGVRTERQSRPRAADGPLASFLDWHARHRAEGKPWRLILNATILDFTPTTPPPPPARPPPTPPSAAHT